MTAPLPLPTVAPVAPTSIADTLGAKSSVASPKKGPSFSDVLAQQRPAVQRPNPSADARPANGSKTPSNNGKTSGDAAGNAENAAATAIDDAVQTATQAEAGALAVAAAQQPATPVVLPQQTLDIAAQAAEQVQLARGAAQAAATTISSGAAVVQAALTANDAIATPRAPVAATAQQAEAAALQASRDAQVALPVVTAAVKPGSTPAPDATAAKTAPAVELPRPVPEAAAPRNAARVPAEPAAAAPLHARNEEDANEPVLSTAQQFQVPQHATNAQDHLAQAVAAAVQRQQPAIANPASVAVPNVPVVMQVATPVGGTHWGTELGQQMVVMSNNVRQGTQTAELRLDPPDLGPLRVSLNLADGVASASFVSAHASVRQAIETAIPQLQQALAQAGISLGQTSVGEQAAQQEFAQQNGGGSQRQGGGNGAAVADGAIDGQQPAVTASRNANALVDTFA
ncbi:flagellar hook-length control protein FliK [Achromobacter sp. UMC71]|uniref:flagellar hook-length control protein FliK n=1 Tax=Achromobacter sp. UMC71 TaxID=1862320 RepID=UPI0015FF06FD|nr:flagellar hook-length control protein FliK [Achromobacter sp. UMC71]MBB1624498.1 flagellar hook-length control protein [Achromobacter sp. UMC71]